MNTAEQKIKAFEDECKRVNSLLHAGLCPTCETPLILKRVTIETLHKRFFGLCKPRIEVSEDFEVKCPKGHQLLHPKYGDRSDLGCFPYSDCLNREISAAHSKYYSGEYDILSGGWL